MIFVDQPVKKMKFLSEACMFKEQLADSCSAVRAEPASIRGADLQNDY